MFMCVGQDGREPASLLHSLHDISTLSRLSDRMRRPAVFGRQRLSGLAVHEDSITSDSFDLVPGPVFGFLRCIACQYFFVARKGSKSVTLLKVKISK